MKTYLLSILDKIQNFSDSLDIKATLCDKSWWLFNDIGEKELFIFQQNGKLINSLNGHVIEGKWQYIVANQSLLISSPIGSFLLRPKFIDTVFLVLQVDGTHEYCFMINEKNTISFHLKTLDALNDYFLQKQQAMRQHRGIWEEERERILNNDRIYKNLYSMDSGKFIFCIPLIAGILSIVIVKIMYDGFYSYWSAFATFLIFFGIGSLAAIFIAFLTSCVLGWKMNKREAFLKKRFCRGE